MLRRKGLNQGPAGLFSPARPAHHLGQQGKGALPRPEWVKVRAFDRNGNAFEVEGTGLTARCFCHELAHLDGHLYTELTDRLYDSDELDELMEENEK